MAFLDLEKAFARVNRNQLWQILNRRGIPYHLIEVIKSLYKNTSVQIDTARKILDKIYINQGVKVKAPLRGRSVLQPYRLIVL
jgi:hypothetical protein